MDQTVAAPAGSTPKTDGRRSLRRDNLFLRLFALSKIPLIWYVRPKIVTLDDDQVVIAVPLRRRNKNHHGTMYFGALAIGADLAAGLVAMGTIEEVRRKSGTRISFVFKDVNARFLRRPDGDVHFTCRQNAAVRALIQRAIASGAREELAVHVTCTVPSTTADEPVAEFVLTISVKKKA